MSGLQSLVDAWFVKRRLDDPYGSVEEFADAGHGALWPYAVIHEQIEAGWSDDESRGALALNLARGYEAPAHALAAFVTLGGRWPGTNATTALNLLALAHRAAPSSDRWLDKFLSHVSLECLKSGLRDPRPLVSEEAANILGGLGQHHFVTATAEDIQPLRELAAHVLKRIDQAEVVALLNERVEAVLSDARSAVCPEGICEVDARLMLKELDPQWVRLAPKTKDTEALAALRTHVAALAWRCTSSEPRAVQVVYVYPANGSTAYRGWAVIDPWVDAVRSLLKEKTTGLPKAPERKVAFDTLDAMSGSLLVTLRVDADESTQEAITKSLQDAKARPIVELDQFDDLGDLLRRQRVRVRVAHIEADGGSASIAVGPDADEPTAIPYRSRKLTTKEIPQANDLDKILAVVDCAGKGDVVTTAAIGVTTERQVQYYKAAARLLALVSTPSGELTRAGWLVYVAKGDDKFSRVRAAFEASPCGQAWIEWARVSKLNEISQNSAAAFLAERSELTGDTVGRRANTLNVWLDALRRH